MAKEIHEQPELSAIRLPAPSISPWAALRRRLPSTSPSFTGFRSRPAAAFYAGLVAKYWFERWARLPVDVDIASEMRYRQGGLEPGGAALFISQSGETADTLATLRHCREQGQSVLSIVNVRSHPSRASRRHDPDAGRSRRSASPSTRPSPVSSPARLPRHRRRQGEGNIDEKLEAELVHASAKSTSYGDAIARRDLRDAGPFSVAGARRSLSRPRPELPIALEGALKLKEISYIHAEGYAAGELKHGPIALIDEKMPVIVIAPRDDLFEKTVSNMQEVAARGGQIILVSDADPESVGCALHTHLSVPRLHPS